MADKRTIEDQLGVNKFITDELSSHIDVDKACPDQKERDTVIKVCPAGLYKLDDAGNLLFDHLGCLECGTCRVATDGTIIKSWNYPVGGFGISFRRG